MQAKLPSTPARLTVAAFLACVAAPVTWASSTASSLAVDGVSTSFGVSSAAVSGSSRSVSPGKAQVAEGRHRVLALVTADDASGPVTLQMEAVDASDRWQLHLPQGVVAQHGLASGDVVVVQHQSWGFAMRRGTEAAPFYLVLHDVWAEGMSARPLR